MHDLEFDMVTYRFNKTDPLCERIGNISVYRVGGLSRYLFPFVAYRQAARLARTRSYLFSWSIMANYAGFAALFFALRFPHMPFLLTLQEGDAISYIKRRVFFVYPLFALIFKRATRVQAISEHLACFARNMGHRGEVAVIPNGVARTFYVTGARWPRHAREEVRVVTTSRLVYKNGIDILVRALALLPASVTLSVAGAGPQQKQLEMLAKRSGLEGRVFFHGEILYNDLPAFLAEGDVYVRPSRSEGLGSAFLEAMAAGLPVVATRVGGIPDIVQHEKTGYLCDAEDVECVSRRVSFIMREDAQQDMRLVVRRARTAADRYTWDIVSRDMRQLMGGLH